MRTCFTGRGRTSHYKQPGSHLTYCGRTAGAPGVGTRMCTRCVTAEARDRAEATATAEAWLDKPTAEADTWRADWIGTRTTSPEPTLFDMTPDAEQGALFA
ncbi:hypothetical protein [Streptomyces sp. SID5910]|uniref:hypothetical protein n=1 Tax=Streptomyces sp. SID5910 TaxID=2690312 RepID=UPI00136D5339|nr:hypothetical protein [Streptomyces sp. SID5910]MYR46614.1 hypothetical protein [Streptomyces sp. SID5910]